MLRSDLFCQGILFPLCQTGTCSIREALILSSVLKRNSISSLWIITTILRLTESNSPINCFFLRVLLEKIHSLPNRMVDALVDYFMGSSHFPNKPVMWSQCILIFIKRFQSIILDEDNEALKGVMFRSHGS